jgi:DNA repair exonuclease SbcCD ATPase subunit
MLHLAQVQNNDSAGGVELQLLARQNPEHTWAVINPESIPLTNSKSLNEGLLILVDLSENREILSIHQAKDWVLDFVQKYLTIEVSPTFLQEEAERVEQWRQDLTLQSQDLTRRNLELEARREQLQTLEEELKQEKQQLEQSQQQLQTLEEELKQEKQKLEEQQPESDSSDTDS